MNVESLRSNQDKNQTSVEVRIAKACITVSIVIGVLKSLYIT
jgi:hypothetical protein